MKCPLCGAPVSEDDLFCGNCGYNLLQNKPAAEGAAPQELSPAGEEAPPAPPPVKEAEEKPFALPPASQQDLTPNKTGVAWQRLIIIAIVLLIILACFCVALCIISGYLGNLNY